MRLRELHRGWRPGVFLAQSRRRMGRHRPQLHLGHDRQSQGRRLSPSRRLSQRARQRARLEHEAASDLSLDAADVPLQRLVLPVDGDGAGRDARVPAPHRGGRHLRGAGARGRQPSLRRADHHEHAAQCAARGEAQARPVNRHDDRRRRAPCRRHRRHRGHGFSHHPCLRAHRSLRPGDLLRLARGMERPAAGRAGFVEGAAGRQLPGARGADGRRSRGPSRPCRATAPRSARSSCAATSS